MDNELVDFEERLANLGSSTFTQLRPSQRYVLQQYAESYRSTPDLAIELPTGAGKTLIALLIAEYYMNQGNRVAVLCGNKQLAYQFEDETEKLNLRPELFEGSKDTFSPGALRRYDRGQALGVMNYWVYFNISPGVDPADLLIMDDVHLAEQALASMFTMSISLGEHSSLYEGLLKEVAHHCPQYTLVQDIINGTAQPFSPPELLSFADQVALVGRFKEIIDASPHAEQGDLYFRWRDFRNRLKASMCLLTPHEIFFRPYVFPTVQLDHYRFAKQRIYLSATIGSSGDLQRRLGVERVTKMPIPERYGKASLGRRLIVFNQEVDAGTDGRIAKATSVSLSRLIEKTRKSVWLCSSIREAKEWKKAMEAWLQPEASEDREETRASTQRPSEPTWLLSPTGDELLQFKESQIGHLLIGGRFDGMDFEHDAARLAVMPSLPVATNPLEEFLSAYLRDASFLRARFGQRLAQAFGRCTRAEDDYAVYFLVDPEFATKLSRREWLGNIPKPVLPEIELGLALTEETIAEGERMAIQFLDGHFDEFDERLEQAKQEVTKLEQFAAAEPNIGLAENEVKGWTALFWNRDYSGASQCFGQCVDALMDSGERDHKAFWFYCLAHSEYLRHIEDNEAGALDRSIDALRKGIKSGSQSAWFNRLRHSLNQLAKERQALSEVDSLVAEPDPYELLFQRWDSLIRRYGQRGARFEKWASQVREDLQSDNHKLTVQAAVQVGQLLGYAAFTSEEQGAPDMVWQSGAGAPPQHVAFEVKIEHDPDKGLSITDVNQVLGQYQAAQRSAGENCWVGSLILTHLKRIRSEATERLGPIKVLPREVLCHVYERILRVLLDYREVWSDIDSRVAAQACLEVEARLPPPDFMQQVVVSKKDYWLTWEDIIGVWPEG